MNIRFSLPLLLLVFIIGLSSCSNFLHLYKKEPDYELKTKQVKQHFCKEKSKLNFAHRNIEKVKVFEKTHKKILKKHKLNFSESAVLWSLFQLAFSPNNTSPSVRFQVLIGNKKNEKLYDFNKRDPRIKAKETFLDGLRQILKDSKSKRNLFQLFNIAQKYFPQDVEVDYQLAKFIQHNRGPLEGNPRTRKYFFKANNPLQPGETFRRLNFNNLKPLLRHTQKGNIPQAPLFSVDIPPEISNGAEVECNMDLNLYGKSIYLLTREALSNNAFAMYSDNGNYFVGITSYAPNWEPIGKTYLIKSNQVSKPEALCLIKNELHKKRTMILSFNGRDPGQHIYHLIQYGLTTARGDHELFEFIKYPRHQFLLDPPRLAFESSKGSKKQLQSLLKLNFPVYNAYTLAEIWILNQQTNPSLITDDRNHTYQSCHLKSKYSEKRPNQQ